MPLPAQSTRLTFPRKQAQILSFPGFPYGINRSVGAKHLQVGELVEGLNIRYTDDGTITTRPGLRKVTSKGTVNNAAIRYISSVVVDQSGVSFDTHYFDEDGLLFGGFADKRFMHYVIVADENHRIYCLDGMTLELIGTADGNVEISSFGGYAMVLDGSYLKCWDGNHYRICYDDGSGAAGYQADYTTETNDAATELYNGGNTRCGTLFTTQSWTVGFTIPILSAEAVLSKTGSPTGSAVAKLYSTLDGAPTATRLASSDNFDISTLAEATPEKITFTFNIDNTHQMEPATQYFLSIEYDGGDASNSVSVHENTATGGGREYYYDTDWKAVTTRNPRIAVKPGRPPKAIFGRAWQNRLWFIDPENTGWVRFTNANTVFDFSTPNGAGYIGSVDDNANSFPVGAIMPHYGDLYVFGGNESPYLSKITGTEPSEYSQQILLQEIQGSPLTVASTINDIWAAGPVNVYSVSGVEQYGDVRTNEPGNPVASIIERHFDNKAFAAFNPVDGQFLLKLSGYDRVLVAHTRKPARMGDGVRYPWTEYLFNGITPSAFGFSIDTFYVGDTSGRLYALDSSVNDNGKQPVYQLKSCVMEHPFNNVLVDRYFLSVDSEVSAAISLKFYRNGSSTPLVTYPIAALSDRVSGLLRFDCRSVQFELCDFTTTRPVNIGGLYLQGKQTEAI